jgi:hypothetical protein
MRIPWEETLGEPAAPCVGLRGFIRGQQDLPYPYHSGRPRTQVPSTEHDREKCFCDPPVKNPGSRPVRAGFLFALPHPTREGGTLLCTDIQCTPCNLGVSLSPHRQRYTRWGHSSSGASWLHLRCGVSQTRNVSRFLLMVSAAKRVLSYYTPPSSFSISVSGLFDGSCFSFSFRRSADSALPLSGHPALCPLPAVDNASITTPVLSHSSDHHLTHLILPCLVVSCFWPGRHSKQVPSFCAWSYHTIHSGSL